MLPYRSHGIRSIMSHPPDMSLLKIILPILGSSGREAPKVGYKSARKYNFSLM